MSKVNKLKTTVQDKYQSAVVTFRGITFMALTLSLVVVTGNAIVTLVTQDLRTEYHYLIAIATAVMVVYSGSLLVRVFSKIGKE